MTEAAAIEAAMIKKAIFDKARAEMNKYKLTATEAYENMRIQIEKKEKA